MEALFSTSLKAGGRTYFIDVKEAANKSKYLTIAESKPARDGEKKFTRSTIMVFDSVAAQFREALDEALTLIQK